MRLIDGDKLKELMKNLLTVKGEYADSFTNKDGYRSIEIQRVIKYIDSAEKYDLRAVLRPFRGKILWAKKHKVSDLYFINIAIESAILSDMLSLPYFKKSDNMYVGMEADKPYTEEELKLWDD